MSALYTEHEGKVINIAGKFKHVMAITLDPRTEYKEGVVRCITNRDGDLNVKGYVDRSELYKIYGNSLEKFEIGERLNIKDESKIISDLTREDWDFIGLEDPDIFIDSATNLLHLYFTIPIKPLLKIENNIEKIKIHLGHAVGTDLDSLEMTIPSLMDNGKFRAKELSVAPINKNGLRLNLIESKDRQVDTSYSVVQVVKAKDMGKVWEYGEIVFHPKDHNIAWIAGHASPGPLFSDVFIDVGPGKRLGIINGREADEKVLINGKLEIKYGIFSVGLFIYDYENGTIDWVSPQPFIRDSEAKIITFASQFVETGKGEGILYAHIDDSFVRAYTIKAELLKSILPN